MKYSLIATVLAALVALAAAFFLFYLWGTRFIGEERGIIKPKSEPKSKPKSKHEPNDETFPAQKLKKRGVRFSPIVEVAAAGGHKNDRFNPDLRDCVARNYKMAMNVGGTKQLAQLSLANAE